MNEREPLMISNGNKKILEIFELLKPSNLVKATYEEIKQPEKSKRDVQKYTHPE